MTAKPWAEADALVLGGGVSGIIAAAALGREGRSVALVDHYLALGGNHKSRSIGPYTFDIGAFLFSDQDLVFSLFPEALKQCVSVFSSVSRLTPFGQIRRYPYDPRSELLGRGPAYTAACLASAATARLRYLRQHTAADFAKFYMGSKIYRDSGLERYIERLFGVPATEIEVEFAAKRLTWIPRAASIRRRVTMGSEPLPAHGRRLVRPRDGFAALYLSMQRTLLALGVRISLGVDTISIRRQGSSFEVETSDGTIRAGRLISTIPLQETSRLIGIAEAVGGLENVDLLSLYFSFHGQRGFPSQILYNFSEDGAWKRITMHSDYYGRADGREYFSVEIALRDDPETLEQDFRASVSRHGLFCGDLRLEGFDITAFAYPIYTLGATARASALINRLSAFGIESVGRQGRFDYIPTADRAARCAIRNVAG